MALALIQTHSAQGNALINSTIIANDSSFTDDNTAAMINENAMPQLCTGMNLDQGKKSGNLRDETRDKKHMMLIKPMGKPMPDQRMDPLIKQQHFQCAPRCRIPLLYGFYIQPDIFQNHNPRPPQYTLEF